MPAPVKLKSRRRLALILFVSTCASTFFVGTAFGQKPLRDGVIYSAALMSILVAHEMGHYVQAWLNKVPATLPYFLPMPLGVLGTMGAVIVQGSGYANRRSLFDIAVTGPLAGLVIALPVTWVGLVGWEAAGVPRAPVGTVKPGTNGLILGEPLLFKAMIRSVHGPLAENQEVLMTPLLMAGWVGIFITALNLIPVGQLDGGHILYTLIGRRAHRVALAVIAGALAYMFATGYYVYSVMLVLLLLMGPRHPPTADDTVSLGPVRYALGWLTLAFIIVGFTPTPIVLPS
ncbi:MAG: site-2 protease family protein, partial [Planctomycetes bacterium]|nr:site-2 protease family protein [Planctomycetota bacterium]